MYNIVVSGFFCNNMESKNPLLKKIKIMLERISLCNHLIRILHMEYLYFSGF